MVGRALIHLLSYCCITCAVLSTIYLLNYTQYTDQLSYTKLQIGITPGHGFSEALTPKVTTDLISQKKQLGPKNVGSHSSDNLKNNDQTDKSVTLALPLRTNNMTSSIASLTRPRDAVTSATLSDSIYPSVSVVTPKGTKYFLTAVLVVRIYPDDKPRLTIRELKQWLDYMLYAGVQHFYVYDNYNKLDEKLESKLQGFIAAGLITYHDYSKYQPYSIMGTQVRAYQHCVDAYGPGSTWQLAMDMDEYPFSPSNKKPCFLVETIKELSQRTPGASELSIPNFLFLGKPKDKEYLIERLLRREGKRSNVLDKPIYRPEAVRSVQIHHNMLNPGHRSINISPDLLRNNHYWGARLQNWGNDTQDILKLTIYDNSMLYIAKMLKIGGIVVNC